MKGVHVYWPIWCERPVDLISSTPVRHSSVRNVVVSGCFCPWGERFKDGVAQSGSLLLSLCRCSSSIFCRRGTGVEQPRDLCGSVLTWKTEKKCFLKTLKQLHTRLQRMYLKKIFLKIVPNKCWQSWVKGTWFPECLGRFTKYFHHHSLPLSLKTKIKLSTTIDWWGWADRGDFFQFSIVKDRKKRDNLRTEGIISRFNLLSYVTAFRLEA